MLRIIGFIFAVSILVASTACGQEKVSTELPPPPIANVALTKTLDITFSKGCEEGFGHIVVELQLGVDFQILDVQCGKLVEGD